MPDLENMALADYPKLGKEFPSNDCVHRAVVSDRIAEVFRLNPLCSYLEAKRGEKYLKGEAAGVQCAPDTLVPGQTSPPAFQSPEG